MALATALLVSAAAPFCLAHPEEPRCDAPPTEQAAMTNSIRARLADIAERAHLNTRYARDTLDEWRLAGPGEYADCEDRTLWAAQEIRRLVPEAVDAYRFVAFIYDRRGGVVFSHLVLIVEAGDRTLVIDTKFRWLRSLRHYRDMEAITPAGGLGGDWAPFTV